MACTGRIKAAPLWQKITITIILGVIEMMIIQTIILYVYNIKLNNLKLIKYLS